MSAMPMMSGAAGARRAPMQRGGSSATRPTLPGLLCAAGLLLTASAAAAAPSEEALERAKSASARGRIAHDRGDYDEAVTAYQEAYVLAPSPALLFNLAQAYRLKGDCDNAVLMYRGYLRTRPELQLRQVAEAHLATVELCASSAVMGEAAPAPAPQVAAAPLPRTAPDDHPGRGLRRGGIVTAIGGGVLLGLGGYFAYRAADASAEVEDRYGRGAPWRQLQDLDEQGDRYDSLALGFALAGGAAAVTGGVLYLVGRRQGERAQQPMVSVSPSKGGGAVRMAWEF